MATTTTAIWMDCVGGGLPPGAAYWVTPGKWGALDDVLAQDQLQGPHAAVLEVEQGLEEGVPVEDGVQQGDDGQNGAR